jgi:hypothetical protein
MGISVELFRKRFAMQSGLSGCASSAANAGVPAELCGQHVDRKSAASQKRYMMSDTEELLSVSRAIIGPPTQAPDVQIKNESARPPPGMAVAELDLDVVGLPAGAFAWS